MQYDIAIVSAIVLLGMIIEYKLGILFRIILTFRVHKLFSHPKVYQRCIHFTINHYIVWFNVIVIITLSSEVRRSYLRVRTRWGH